MSIPVDIIDRIERDFCKKSEKAQVLTFLKQLYSKNFNVGRDQLCRSILFLVNGKPESLEQFSTIEDPRDVIMEAGKKAGNPGHYFLKPFET